MQDRLHKTSHNEDKQNKHYSEYANRAKLKAVVLMFSFGLLEMLLIELLLLGNDQTCRIENQQHGRKTKPWR